MNLRGGALADHVGAGMAAGKSAAAIAAGAGYQHVERCAQNLAAAGYAPMARRLLARHRVDLLTAPAPAPEPIGPKKTGRPGRTKDEIIDELTDMSACGLTFDQAAERLGVQPHSLQCAIYSKGLTEQVRGLFPDRFARRISDDELVARLVELAESGESYVQAAAIVGYKPQSLAQRLRFAGVVGRVKAAFGGVSLWRREVA